MVYEGPCEKIYLKKQLSIIFDQTNAALVSD